LSICVAAGIGGTRYAGAPAVEEHTGRIPWFGGAIEKHGGVTRDAPCVHRTGGYGDADRIQQKIAGLIENGLREHSSGATQDEIGDADGNAVAGLRPLTSMRRHTQLHFSRLPTTSLIWVHRAFTQLVRRLCPKIFMSLLAKSD
jgi:hypothetical protein